MQRWYPDERDKKQYADWISLLVIEEAIYTGELTEKNDGLGLLDGKVEGDGDGYQKKEDVEIWLK